MCGHPQESNLENDILLQTILPVVVTQKDTNKAVNTYTFYDNDSAGCCITEGLRTRLAGNKYRYEDSIRNYARPEPCR